MRSIAKSTSEDESIQIVSYAHRESEYWWNLELAASNVVYANAEHLERYRVPQSDMKRQKIGIFKENSQKWVEN